MLSPHSDEESWQVGGINSKKEENSKEQDRFLSELMKCLMHFVIVSVLVGRGDSVTTVASDDSVYNSNKFVFQQLCVRTPLNEETNGGLLYNRKTRLYTCFEAGGATQYLAVIKELSKPSTRVLRTVECCS